MSKRRILIIDDDKNFTTMVKFSLEEIGPYDVFIENDSVRAVETAKIFQPEVILLDVIMPMIEGPDVYQELKQQVAFKDTPIVFLTATVRKDEVARQDGMIGGHRFLAKPGSIEELLDCIEKCFLTPPYRLDFT